MRCRAFMKLQHQVDIRLSKRSEKLMWGGEVEVIGNTGNNEKQ